MSARVPGIAHAFGGTSFGMGVGRTIVADDSACLRRKFTRSAILAWSISNVALELAWRASGALACCPGKSSIAHTLSAACRGV